MNRKSDFPYPVLKYGGDSGYLENIKFYIKENQPEFEIDKYKIKLSITNASTNLNEMIEKELCAYYVSYSTKNISNTYKISNTDYMLEIPLSQLESEDQIKIIVNIIAESDFDLYWNEEIDIRYNLGECFEIKRKDVIAVSNFVMFSYSTTGDTIIKLQTVNETDHRGMKIEAEEQYIYVKVNDKFNENYQFIINGDKKGLGKDILNSSLIYLVLVNVFCKIIKEKNIDKYQQYRWFNIINNTFSGKEINFENEILETDEDDIDKVYTLVDVFMNYSFEESIKKTGERVRKYED